MTPTEHGRHLPEPGIRALLLRIRYDLTSAQAKLTDAFTLLDTLGITEKPRASFPNGPVTADQCPECGVNPTQGHAAGCAFADPDAGKTRARDGRVGEVLEAATTAELEEPDLG